jgi:methylthioribose-1-phosphate isomerase
MITSLPDPVLDRSVRLDREAVCILDRRRFPHEISWVAARDDIEVARAIKDMVTQSSGPLFAALAGMTLTARQHSKDTANDLLNALRAAAARLAAARPTNNHVRDAVTTVMSEVDRGSDTAAIVEQVEQVTARLDTEYRTRSHAIGTHTAALLPDNALVLTHCWMDTYLVELVRAAHQAGKYFRYLATETRPYLQGARLTAHTLAEMGQEVTLITDGMVAAVFSPHSKVDRVDALVTAADRVSLDGHVFNKVGTLGAAIAARAFGVPYYALVQAPDPQAPTAADVIVEQRDGAENLSTLGARTASPLVRSGYYPAFDVTPPEFVTRVVTDRGAFEPSSLADYGG